MLCLHVLLQFGLSLSDEPLHGADNQVFLVGNWTAFHDHAFSMPAAVPGDLVSDLELHGGGGGTVSTAALGFLALSGCSRHKLGTRSAGPAQGDAERARV